MEGICLPAFLLACVSALLLRAQAVIVHVACLRVLEDNASTLLIEFTEP